MTRRRVLLGEVLMLPFLQKSKDRMVSSLLDSRGEKSSNPERTEITPDVETQPDEDQSLDSAASSLLNAFERKSVPDIKQALKDCFDCLKGS